MNIISKYKDYYDYLTGIYGVDNKIVLDRRYSGKYDYPIRSSVYDPYLVGENNIAVFLHICGVCYGGVYYHKDKKIYWCKELEDLGLTQERIMDKKKVVYLYDEIMRRHSTVIVDPTKSNINEKYGIPIMLQIHDFLFPYPQLSKLGFNRQVSPHDMYIMLSNYLSPKDKVEDNMNDIEKIKSHGFDTKISFRGKQK